MSPFPLSGLTLPGVSTPVLAAIIATTIGTAHLSAAPVHEVVAAIERTPSSPARGPLAPGPDGFLWGAAYSGGIYGAGALYKVDPGSGKWQSAASFYQYGAVVDGKHPNSGLVLDDSGWFWGTTREGGSQNHGTVFKANPLTGELVKVREFSNNGSSNKGRRPVAGLVRGDDGFLWGLTYEGGALDDGTVFKVNPATGALSTVVQFTSGSGTASGANPLSALARGAGGFLWGITSSGGAQDLGTIFKINTRNGRFTTVLSFTGDSGAAPGSRPTGGLLRLDDGTIWGTTYWGGVDRKGSVFKLNESTGALSTVLSFSGLSSPALGAFPDTTLVTDGSGFIWGTTNETFGNGSTGSSNSGTLFKIEIATGAFTSVARFYDEEQAPFGRSPVGLFHDGHGQLWGTTSSGGRSDNGVVYRMDLETESIDTVVDFPTGNIEPSAGLTSDPDGWLWGVSPQGGALEYGTVFKLHPLTGELITIIDFTDEGDQNRGRYPLSGLVTGPDGLLWGATARGGRDDDGTIFKIDPATGILTTVRELTGRDPADPSSPLVPDGHGYLWGTTNPYGGNGTIYKIHATTGELTRVVEFTRRTGDYKGAFPHGGLVPDANGMLWGTTGRGGDDDNGTVYKIDPVSGAFTTLVEFTNRTGAHPGYNPIGGMAFDPAGFMWGTTWWGGSLGYGTVFKVNTSTGAHTTVIDFTDNGSSNKGRDPVGGMLYDNGFVWGTTEEGGAPGLGSGTVFKVDAARGSLTTVVNFASSTDIGRGPSRGFLYKHSDGNIYGATTDDGPGGEGTIYRLRFGPSVSTDPVLNITTYGASLNATVNPNGRSTRVNFEYGTSPTLDDAITVIAGRISGSTARTIRSSIQSLTPGTTYYVRAVASNTDNPIPQAGAIIEFSTEQLIIVDEGSEATNSGSFSDIPGEIVSITADLGSVTRTDPPGGGWAWSYTPPDGPLTTRVTLTATDDSMVAYSYRFTLQIANVAPQLTLDPPAGIDEDGFATLSGTITDPGTLDTFQLDIDWGDPLSTGNQQSVPIAANPGGSGTFSITHRYLDDNPTGTARDRYLISADLSDDDGGSDSGSAQVLVTNVRPTIQLDPMIEIDGNGMAQLHGTITDPGTLDTFLLYLDWGDPQSPDNFESLNFASSPAGSQTFTLTHHYPGTSQNAPVVFALLLDDEGASSTASAEVSRPTRPAGIDEFVLLPDGRAIIGFPTTIGETYLIEMSEDLQHWITVHGPIPGTGNREQWIDEFFPPAPRRFYRFLRIPSP